MLKPNQICGFVLSLLFVVPGGIDAAMYSDSQLMVSKSNVESNIRAMIKSDIPRALPKSTRPSLEGVRVELPLRGRNPLDFHSYPDQKRVVVPVNSIRFFDDLAILAAWFEHKKCRAEYIQTYLYALLRAKKPLENPIDAFGLNRDRLLAVDAVDKMSLKITKSGIYFILSHELGHIYHRHRGGLTGASSIAQEMDADRFALDVFAGTGEPPAGAVVYFMAVRWTDPLDRDAPRYSHPLSQRRISTIGQRMITEPQAFSFADKDQVVARGRALTIGREMVKIGAELGNEGMLTDLHIGLEREFPISGFKSACRD